MGLFYESIPQSSYKVCLLFCKPGMGLIYLVKNGPLKNLAYSFTNIAIRKHFKSFLFTYLD